jgi:hypothetical protein
MGFDWITALNFHSYITFPASALFMMYAIGAALLKGDWYLLPWAIGALLLSVILQFALALLSS